MDFCITQELSDEEAVKLAKVQVTAGRKREQGTDDLIRQEQRYLHDSLKTGKSSIKDLS